MMLRLFRAFALAAVAAPSLAFAGPASVPIGDLDLSAPEGQSRFYNRVEAAAHRYCNTLVWAGLGRHRDCLAAVRAELAGKMSEVQQAQAGKPTDYAAR